MGYHASLTNEISQMEIDNQNKVRKFGAECIVVLENDGTLPLQNKGKIALFGPGARHMVKGGTGSGDVNSRSVVNIEEGLKEAGFEITTTSWLDRFDKIDAKHKEDYMAFIKRLCEERNTNNPIGIMFEHPITLAPLPEVTDADIDKECDTAIYVVTRDSGEGGDRKYDKGDYKFADDEISVLKTISEKFKKLIVLLNIGGVMNVIELKEIPGINAIVNISQLGNIGGNIVADALTGVVEPSGRLSDTWAKSYEDYPNWQNFSHNNGDVLDEYYNEGIYVGYRYFDTFDVEPLYPFGYGLGYSKHDINVTSVTMSGTNVYVNVEVKNVGAYAGKEVVQVYVSAPEGSIDKPYQELAAFAKTPVTLPGESANIKITFDITKSTSYDVTKSARVLEAGNYIIRVGKNSRSTKAVATISLSETIVVEQLKKLFEDKESFEEFKNPHKKPSFNNDLADLKEATKLTLDPSSITTKVIEYTTERSEIIPTTRNFITFNEVLNGYAPLEQLVAQLTPYQLAELCVGAFADGISTNIVGCASVTVPGAAAESTSALLEERKVPVMVLADGPAGIRIQPHFKADGIDGQLLPGGQVFGMSFFPFPDDLPETAVDYYQYCTAIPIATALAQTWNMDLIYEAGNIVGSEMKKFFVHFWLAPGMNIHRNPLCGRNFEYYSEDPLLAGRCAAADTNGVQSHGGQGTTIKHFAGNNQEDNRMFSNSHISERALRDIYLRSFEITVKESQPYSIMTSYNLINGTHAANNYDLIQNAARDEWGFEGVMMTDWCTTMQESECKHPKSYADLCIKAGNDWTMPGCQNDIDEILDGLSKGSITLGDLQFCAMNVLKMAVKCYS